MPKDENRGNHTTEHIHYVYTLGNNSLESM